MEQKEKEIKRNKRVGYFELVINIIVIFYYILIEKDSSLFIISTWKFSI